MRSTRVAVALLVLSALLRGAAAETHLRRPGGKQLADYDSKSFRIGDRRVLLLSGGVHYFRIPPSEWRHRLVQTKLAGFNCIETPIPWNLHEPAKGQLVTEGIADVGRFLDLCHELGLLAIVRVGPYVNATLSNGGLPAWLGGVTKLRIRSPSPRFIEAVRDYWRKLLPIVIRRQVPAGPVVLVQVEDHYRASAGGYLTKLFDELVVAGCRVPIVLSDLNPCNNFQQARITDDKVWATTELMPTPPVPWGKSNRPFPHLDDIVLEGIARGIDGYNLSLWCAGTHFAVLPASSFPTRFESSTFGIQETGALTPVHTELKRVNLFAAAFADVLTEAVTTATHRLVADARRTGAVAYGRTDGTTTLAFVKRRHGSADLALTDPATGRDARLRVGSVVYRHLVAGYPLSPKTVLSLSTAQILTIQKLPGRVLIVAYAPAGSEAAMVFQTPTKPTFEKGSDAMAWAAPQKTLVLMWKDAGATRIADYVFRSDQRIHVIAVREEDIERAWVLDGAGVLLGAPGVGRWTPSSVEVLLPAKRGRYPMSFYPFGRQRAIGKAQGISGVKHDPEARRIDFALDTAVPTPTNILLRKWEMARLGNEVEPAFSDSRWPGSPRPEPLGEEPYGWYRATIRSDRACTRTLILKDVADAATVFLNGQYIGQSATKRLMDAPRSYAKPLTFSAPIRRGDNVLAVLVKNWGRYSLAATYGKPLTEASGWGLLDDVTLDGVLVTPWRRRGGMSPEGRSLTWGPPAKGGSPVRWYRCPFKIRKTPAHKVGRVVLRTLGHGGVWVNGHFAGLYIQRGFDSGHGYYVPPAWLGEQNVLMVLEEGGYVPGESAFRFDRDACYAPVRVTFQ